jgi:hypothetical protein
MRRGLQMRIFVPFIVFLLIGTVVFAANKNCERALKGHSLINYDSSFDGHLQIKQNNTKDFIIGRYNSVTGELLPYSTFLQSSFNYWPTQGIPKYDDPLLRVYFSHVIISEDHKTLTFFAEQKDSNIPKLVVGLKEPFTIGDNIISTHVATISAFYKGISLFKPIEFIRTCLGWQGYCVNYDISHLSDFSYKNAQITGPEADEIYRVLRPRKLRWHAAFDSENNSSFAKFRGATLFRRKADSFDFTFQIHNMTPTDFEHLKESLKELGLRNDHPVFSLE